MCADPATRTQQLTVFALVTTIGLVLVVRGSTHMSPALVGWLAALCGMAAALARTKTRSRLVSWMRWILPAAALISIYELLGHVIAGLGVPARDQWVLNIERVFTRGRLPPLGWWAPPSLVVDGLSIAYAAYFVLPIILLWMLACRGQRREAQAAALTLLIAFYVHYAIYIVMPVVGPVRAPEVPIDLRMYLLGQGGRITHLLRAGVAALEATKQDAFPSAHTSVTCLVAALARKHRVPGQWAFHLVAAAVVSSTLVLGYHYVVDVVAAVPIACLAWRASQARGSRVLIRNFRGGFVRHLVSTAVVLLALVSSAWAQDRTTRVEFGAGVGEFVTAGAIGGPWFPSLKSRVNLTPRYAIDTLTDFDATARQGVNGMYSLEVHQAVARSARSVMPFVLYGVHGQFEYFRQTHGAAPFAVTGGAGYRVRLADRLFLEASAQALFPVGDFRPAMRVNAGVMIPLAR
jgi:membrane-associated phospholipid phosphatase